MNLNCMDSNTSYLPNKLMMLNDSCLDQQLNLVAMTGTQFQSDISNADVGIDNMEIIKRNDITKGGGLALDHLNDWICAKIAAQVIALSYNL